MKKFILAFLLFSSPAFADLQLNAVTDTGFTGNYWVIALQAFNKTVIPTGNDTELMVIMYLYKDKAAFDAGSSKMDEINFVWDEAARSSFSSTDLSDDGTLFLDLAYAKIKTLSAVPYRDGTLDFTTATEPQ